jgi:hypothetical protein
LRPALNVARVIKSRRMRWDRHEHLTEKWEIYTKFWLENPRKAKREEDGSWRKLHNDEHHSLYSSLNQGG